MRRPSDSLDEAEQPPVQQEAFYEPKEEGYSEAATPVNLSQASAATVSTVTDPWQATAQIGGQFVAALASAHNPDKPAHPWVERDEQTGSSHLKIPVSPPETTRQLADTFAALAEMLRKLVTMIAVEVSGALCHFLSHSFIQSNTLIFSPWGSSVFVKK